MRISNAFNLCIICFSVFALIPSANSCLADVYEMRTYVTNEGKLDDLNARFRDHTVALFKRHGMESVGYWVPTDGGESKNTLIYIIRHQSRDAAKKSWQAFMADPDWQKAYKESEADGDILAQPPESVYMEATDYSPTFEGDDDSPGVYELRVYTTAEGKLDALNARFRDHTMKIFDRHGIENVGYCIPTDGPKAANTLIYLVRHKSRDAAKESWRAFGADEDWKKVAAETRKDGRLVTKVQRTYMKPTDYSALK